MIKQPIHTKEDKIKELQLVIEELKRENLKLRQKLRILEDRLGGSFE